MRTFETNDIRTPFEIIYFIKCGSYVKIGTSRSDVMKRRLHALQVANPVRLEPLGYRIGGHPMELEYHHALDRHKASGEWFHLRPFLAAHIENVALDFCLL